MDAATNHALGIMLSEPKVWYAILFGFVLIYAKGLRSDSSQGAKLGAAIMICLMMIPIYTWKHPGSSFSYKNLPISSSENYALNAPYIFPVNFQNIPRRVDVFSIMDCSPANKKIRAVMANLPSDYQVFYHDISKPQDGTLFHDLLLPTGKINGFVGPVFILNGKAFFYNPKIIEQIKTYLPAST